MKHFIPLVAIPFLMASLASAQDVRLHTGDFSLSISETGRLTEMSNPLTGTNVLAIGQKAPLLKVRVVGSDWEEPAQAVFNAGKSVVTLTFPVSKVTAEVKVIQSKTHLVFELISLNADNRVSAVCWGPYPTSINKTIGEVIGVVRDGEYAVGLQSLNTKTLGGVLKNAEGADEGRGSVAIKQSYGSSLQAFSLDRSKPRSVTVWHASYYTNMPVAPIANETTIGSKIALFGCAENQVLQRIGEIEVTEGLPHPLINGVWLKQSPETGRAYLISDFDETNIDALLAYTQEAGLMSLYHPGPFKTWGHFILDAKKFPHGNTGMKACVDKAAKLGLRLGTHTLTTFITTDDPYVTPVPDKRLALTGSSTLSESILASTKEISVQSDEYFKNLSKSTEHAVRIGEEIIRFREVTSQPPYKLLDCQRGAYGTVASKHEKGETAGMLMDYPYKTLFPNFDLQQEIAGNLARFFNETGVSQLDFDGHEGCWSSGEGDYGMEAFADKVIRGTSHTLVNGTSNSSHYYWHMCSYWNWGEPWYGGFRESQSDVRMETQPFLERNYMPHMLGWFSFSATTTQEDIEWLMARAAGYNAGFALVAPYQSLQANPNTAQLLALIKLWQEAYKNKIFSADQLARLKNPGNDFHLEKDRQEWKLFPFEKCVFEHIKKTLQPGEPALSGWNFENRNAEQPLAFTLIVLGKEGAIENPWIELDGYNRLELPGEVKAGFSIVCDGKKARLYNDKGSYDKEIILKQAPPRATVGKHTVKFDCAFPGGDELKVRFIVKTIMAPEAIQK